MKPTAEGVEKAVHLLVLNDPQAGEVLCELLSVFFKNQCWNSLVPIEWSFSYRNLHGKGIHLPTHPLPVQETINKEGYPGDIGLHQDRPSLGF